MGGVTEPRHVPLRVSSRAAPSEVRVVELEGELVVTNLGAVREAIESILDGGGRSIIVDAAGLSYVDTPSLALLVRLATRCRENGGALVLVGLPAAFTPLVDALRLEEAVTMGRNVGEAVERLAG